MIASSLNPSVGRPTTAGLAPREVDERDPSALARLTGQGAPHDELGVVGVGAERSDVERVHESRVSTGARSMSRRRHSL